MRLFFVAAVMLMSFGQAYAQRFTGNTVFMAVQCDIGRFAETAGQIGLDPRMMAAVDFSWSVETSIKVETSWKISDLTKWLIGGPSVQAAKSWEKVDDEHIKGTFNVHEKNTAACQKNVLQVPLGISDCLADSADALIAGAEASCDKTRVVQGSLNGNGSVVIWKVFDADIGGSYDIKTTYKIKVSAPVRDVIDAAAAVN